VIRRAVVDDAAAIARVHVDSWRAAYRGLVPQPYLDNLSYADREERWRNLLGRAETATFVATSAASAGGTIVGFASCGERKAADLYSDGELYALYLLQSHWRRGLGKQLLEAALAELGARGYGSMGLWVLRDNAALHFYQALGGVRSGGGEQFVGGACLDKVAFVWRLGPPAAELRPVGGG
jgi:ribosomal protein S18 acetylase RimI-like enzyme